MYGIFIFMVIFALAVVIQYLDPDVILELKLVKLIFLL